MKTTITFNIAALSPQGKVFLNILRNQSARFHDALTPNFFTGDITATIADDEAKGEAIAVSVVDKQGKYQSWTVPVGIVWMYTQKKMNEGETWNLIADAFEKWSEDNDVMPSVQSLKTEQMQAPESAARWRDLYIEGHFMRRTDEHYEVGMMAMMDSGFHPTEYRPNGTFVVTEVTAERITLERQEGRSEIFGAQEP